jgi:hypothetical protein
MRADQFPDRSTGTDSRVKFLKGVHIPLEKVDTDFFEWLSLTPFHHLLLFTNQSSLGASGEVIIEME